MSLTSKLNKAATIAPLALALTTNVMAQNPLPRIEPSATDLSKPIPNAVCVDTTTGQTGSSAWDKLATIMSARNQMIAVEGDQVVAGPNSHQAKLVTVSNNFTGKEGYIISSEVPNANRKQSPSLCLMPVSFSIAVNQKENVGIPKVLNKGELGVALTNHDKVGDKVSIAGMYTQGSLFAVIINSQTHKGVMYMADATGNKAAAIAALVDFDYSAKMKQVFESLSSQKPNDTSNSTNAPSAAAPQLKP